MTLHKNIFIPYGEIVPLLRTKIYSLLRISILSCSLFFIALSCSADKRIEKNKTSTKKSIKPIQRDLQEIQKSGVLRAITVFSPTGYFLYKGQTMGFEYEMLSRLAKTLEVELEIVIATDIDSIIPLLNQGKGDIIAMGYTITKERKKIINFTNPYITTHQTLVQKKPNNWRKMTLDNIKKSLATDIVDLLNDTVSVRKNTSYYNRLLDISDELGDTIYIDILSGKISNEEAMELVSNGNIKYTIMDNNIATIYKSNFPNIDISTPISLSQRIAWAVRKNSPNLLVEMNKNLTSIKKKADYNVIYKKYFENKSQFKKRLKSTYFTETTGKISKYDAFIKENKTTLDWDWRLVSALVFQESEFHPHKKSWAGAAGLMQLMPNTAKELGVKNAHNPEGNLKAGMLYLNKMYDLWGDIPDTTQRIKFAMASYNSGFGHVKDAQRLAKKYNKNSLRWEDGVDTFILKLAKSEYYQDTVVKYGYARGTETYQYVIEIFNRYENYKAFVEE